MRHSLASVIRIIITWPERDSFELGFSPGVLRFLSKFANKTGTGGINANRRGGRDNRGEKHYKIFSLRAIYLNVNSF